MGLMLGEFVDEYTVRVVDVFAMPQSGTGVSVEAVDHVFQTNMLDMLKQTGRYFRLVLLVFINQDISNEEFSLIIIIIMVIIIIILILINIIFIFCIYIVLYYTFINRKLDEIWMHITFCILVYVKWIIWNVSLVGGVLICKMEYMKIGDIRYIIPQVAQFKYVESIINDREGGKRCKIVGFKHERKGAIAQA